MLSLIILLAAVTILLTFLQWRRNYPPGPWSWIPLFGNIFLVKKLSRQFGSLEAALDCIAKKYKTNILGLNMAGSYTVVVFGEKLAQRVLLGKEFQARPQNFFTNLRSFGTNKGISMTDGKLWQEQKSFLIRQLSELGFDGDKKDILIEKEFKNLLQIIGPGGSNIQLSKILEVRIINVIWMFVSSEEIVHDHRLPALVQLMNERSRAFDISGGTLGVLPWLRFLAPKYTGYQLIQRINQKLYAIVSKAIESHKMTYNKDITRDYIDAFLHQMYSNKEGTTFTDDQLMMMCLDIFIASLQTTTHTLEFSILYLVNNQDIQARVQNELDSYCKGDQIPKYEERTNFPYLNGVISEVMRIRHVLPLYGPRRALHNTMLDGYFIPKGSTILIGMSSLNFNQDKWSEPHKFNPERFLVPLNDKRTYPFGIGKRRCPGEVMARSFITVFLAGLLRFYNLEPLDGSPPPSLKTISGITQSPLPYRLKLTRRQPLP